MRIFPRQLQIGDSEGFSVEKDIFGRCEFGAGLSNLVGSVNDPMVIAIDGQWGSGKTTFLKMWAGDLRQKGFPVIYFDAFVNDYMDDAFSALAAEIVSLIDREKKAAEPKSKAFLNKAVGASKIIARSALKVGVKVATAGALGATDFENLAEAVSSEAEEVADKHIGELLTKQAERRDTLQAFRDALRDLPAILTPKSHTPREQDSSAPKPLIFIIDELDRCTPIFALKILERIKHFFAVENVHFVLGAHMGQLRTSVCAAYGANIDATTYLQKFISLTFPLTDHAGHVHERAASKYISYLTKEIDVAREDYDFHENAIHFTRTYALLHESSFRDIEHFLTNIALASAFTTKRTLRPAPLMAGLSILRVVQPSLYAKAKRGVLQYSDIEDVFGFKYEGKDADDLKGYSDFERGWWQFTTNSNAEQNLIDRYNRSLFDYNVRDRFSIIPLIAHKVIDKLIEA